MKYAVINQRGGVNRVSDTEPQHVPENASIEEISDEQASLIEAGRTATPRVHYFWIEGELKTMAEKQALAEAERRANMTPEQKIALGEAHVAQAGLTASRLVTLMDLLLTVKEADALASHPKLVAFYSWLQTVKGTAIAGGTTFTDAPYTFEEVVSE